jgi:hypothetical protein
MRLNVEYVLLNDRALHVMFGAIDLYEDEHVTLFTTQTSDSGSIIAKQEKNKNAIKVFITPPFSPKSTRIERKIEKLSATDVK